MPIARALIHRGGKHFTGPITSGVGFGAKVGDGGAVTQATNRTTGVTLNKVSGAITTHTASLAAEGTADFVVTNRRWRSGMWWRSRNGRAATVGTIVTVAAVAAGSFTLR